MYTSDQFFHIIINSNKNDIISDISVINFIRIWYHALSKSN